MNFVDKMKRAFLKRVQNAGTITNRATGFTKREGRKHHKTTIRKKLGVPTMRQIRRKIRRKLRGSPIIKVRSMLWIKRNFTDNHCRARLYKRTFKGVCGAWTWKELDKMFPRPKAAPRVRRMKMPEAMATEIPKKGFLSRLADKVSNALPFRRRGMA